MVAVLLLGCGADGSGPSPADGASSAGTAAPAPIAQPNLSGTPGRAAVPDDTSPLAVGAAAGALDSPSAEPSPAVPMAPRAPGCAGIDLAPPEAGVQLALEVPVPSGSEVEYCQLVMLDRDLNLHHNEGYLTEGAHHGLIRRTGYRDVMPLWMVNGLPFGGDPSQPHPCPTGPETMWASEGVIASGRAVRLQGMDDATAGGRLPDNVAVPLQKGDILLLNFHVINTSDEPVQACYKANLESIPDEQVEMTAGLFNFYNPHITIPAGGTGRAHMACPVLEDVSLLNAVSHMHERGVRAEARLWQGVPHQPGSQLVAELYDQDTWFEPPVVTFEPLRSLKAGQWIEWSCDYQNSEGRPVAQGTAASDEMCAFFGVYFPRNAAMELCANPDDMLQQLNAISLSDGDMDGPAFLDCLTTSPLVFTGHGDDPRRYETLRCFTETCRPVSLLTQPLLHCGAVKGIFGCSELIDEIAATGCEP